MVDRGLTKKQYSAPEYLEKRKQEKERRRSEIGLKQKFKKNGRKSETTNEVKIVPNIFYIFIFFVTFNLILILILILNRILQHRHEKIKTKILASMILEKDLKVQMDADQKLRYLNL